MLVLSALDVHVDFGIAPWIIHAHFELKLSREKKKSNCYDLFSKLEILEFIFTNVFKDEGDFCETKMITGGVSQPIIYFPRVNNNLSKCFTQVLLFSKVKELANKF